MSKGIVGGVDTKSSNVAISLNSNILDNWYLLDPINQRGISGIFNTVGNYFIDRWILADGSVELTDEGLKLNGTIQQRLENSIEKEVVATALSTNGLVNAEYDDTSKTFSITAEDQTIIAAKLELGSQQSLAYQDEEGAWVLSDLPPNQALELVKCQKYLQEISLDGVYAVESHGILDIYVRLMTAMKSSPTTIGTPRLAIRAVNSSTNIFTTSMVLKDFRASGLDFYVNPPSGTSFTIGGHYWAWTEGGTNVKSFSSFLVSCEL